MRYFEIEFDNEPRNQDGSEEDVSGEYSICIPGESEPTIQEATEFYKSDMEQEGVSTIPLEECVSVRTNEDLSSYGFRRVEGNLWVNTAYEKENCLIWHIQKWKGNDYEKN